MNKWLYIIIAGFFFFLAFNYANAFALFSMIAFLFCLAAAMDVYALPEKKSEIEATRPEQESNGEELAPESSVYFIRVPSEEANDNTPEGCTSSEWDEVRRMCSVEPRAVEGGNITLEILK